MISVKQLTKSFGEFTAVDSLSFDLSPGDIVGFLGPNGAGKSTTMKMLTGFLTPSAGDISINEKSLDTHRTEIQSSIGYLPEGAPLYGEMTVSEFLSFIADVRELKNEKKAQAIRTVVDKVSLHKVLDKPIDTLSKGFRRRVGLAQALIHDPSILILDEPTDGLDPNQKHQVRELIQALSKEKIVIISTHILEEVSALCNRVMVIAEGAMKFDGTPDELLAKSRYRNAVRLHLSYAADAGGLQGIEGVADIEEDLKNGMVTLFPEEGKSIVHLVSDYVQQYRLPVDQMKVEEGHLEDVFRMLTTTDNEAGVSQ